MPEQSSRGGAAPDYFELDVPGVNRAGVWVREHMRSMGKPLETTTGHGRARGRENGCGCGGDSRRWCSPACGVPAVPGATARPN